MYWDNGHMDNGWGIAMMLVMVGFFALIAFAIVWFARSNNMMAGRSASATDPSGTKSAESILAERLARGEIELEDYRARLGGLRG